MLDGIPNRLPIMNVNNAHHQNSLREARPEKVQYLEKHVLIDCANVMI